MTTHISLRKRGPKVIGGDEKNRNGWEDGGLGRGRSVEERDPGMWSWREEGGADKIGGEERENSCGVELW